MKCHVRSSNSVALFFWRYGVSAPHAERLNLLLSSELMDTEINYASLISCLWHYTCCAVGEARLHTQPFISLTQRHSSLHNTAIFTWFRESFAFLSSFTAFNGHRYFLYSACEIFLKLIAFKGLQKLIILYHCLV